MRHHDPEIVAREVIHIAAELADTGPATMRRARDMASVLRSSPDGPSSKGTVSDPTGNLATSKPDRSLAAYDEYRAAVDRLLQSAYDVERIGRWINAGNDAAYIDGMREAQKESERETECRFCCTPGKPTCDACRQTLSRWTNDGTYANLGGTDQAFAHEIQRRLVDLADLSVNRPQSRLHKIEPQRVREA